MLVLTQGDPAGIGPEITVKAWQAVRHSGPAFVFLGAPELLEGAAPVQVVSSIAEAEAVFPPPFRFCRLVWPRQPYPAHRTAAMRPA